MHSPYPLYDTAAVRAAEASAAGGDAFALMARAGEAGWRCVLRHWPRALRIVVACGPGNNGGDGYVLARHALEAGRDVRVVRLAPPASAIAGRACREYEAAGGRVEEFTGSLPDGELVVDAVFGIGLSRAPDGAAAGLVAAINAHAAPVLALDVPSGIDADRGHAPGAAVVADRTLQLLARHRGLRTGAALDHAGELDLAALDLPADALAAAAPAALAWRADALAGFFPLRPRDSHKGRNGHVLCIGGDSGTGGAILLTAEAALRAGAGLVSVATRASHAPALLARRPELMVHAVEDGEVLAGLLERADVIALGPGLGRSAWSRAVFDAAWRADPPRVVDADALALLAAARGSLRPQDIATPHPGEAARLLGVDPAAIQRDRFGAAQTLQGRLGGTVVLKGAGTLVASSDQPPAVVCAGNPGMAVAGMGDLLTGCIAALRAQGLHAHEAGVAGALLHAAAGDAAVREEGERGLLPSDLLPWLRRLANPLRR